MNAINIQYIFIWANGSQDIFNLQIDAKSLELHGNIPNPLPAWTNLDFHQCPHCPLEVNIKPYCPLAANLVNLVTYFKGASSYDKIHLDVITEERVISQDTTIQRAVSSLLGLVMSTSGCPYTAFFRPMARFHLPLASEEETIYRATSMYLLAQYFLKKEGYGADLELQGLTRIYNNIQIVNTTITERLRSASDTDSTINAVVLLDVYAKTLPYVIEEYLEEISYLFASFLDNKLTQKIPQ